MYTLPSLKTPNHYFFFGDFFIALALKVPFKYQSISLTWVYLKVTEASECRVPKNSTER